MEKSLCQNQLILIYNNIGRIIPNKEVFVKRIIIIVFAVGLLLMGCSSTHKVIYPASDILFVTCGDDPGSESDKPYIPKGQIIQVTSDVYAPIPIIGMFMKFGNAEPQYVFDNYVIPEVKRMGGDALIGANVVYKPAGPIIFGLVGARGSNTTIITGTVVKR